MTPVSTHQLGEHLFETYAQKPQLKELFYVKQVHGGEITPWKSSSLEDEDSDGICIMFDELKDYPYVELHLAIKTADCLSVAIIGDKGAINLHAGWRGLAAEILFHPLVEKCRPHTFLLSAAIAQENYQVGPEFEEVFANFPQGLSEKKDSKELTFSLHTTAQHMIESRYPNARIICDDLDTFSHPSLNSFRKDRTKERNWNVLKLSLAKYRISEHDGNEKKD